MYLPLTRFLSRFRQGKSAETGRAPPEPEVVFNSRFIDVPHQSSNKLQLPAAALFGRRWNSQSPQVVVSEVRVPLVVSWPVGPVFPPAPVERARSV